MTDKDGEV